MRKKTKTSYGGGGRASFKRRLKKQKLSLDVEAHVMNDIWAVLYMTFGILTILSIRGNLGVLGDLWLACLRPVFGWGIYVMPAVLIIMALLSFFAKKVMFGLARWLGIVLFSVALLGTIHLSVPADDIYEVAKIGQYGGYVGFVASFISREVLGVMGSYVVFLAMMIVSVLLMFDVSLTEIVEFLTPSKKRRRLSLDEEEVPEEEDYFDDFDVQGINIIKPEQIAVERKAAVRDDTIALRE
ncbi:MAG: DNA translocase FtsK 4TM domain-containing protein, partial [Candidatus Gracilibacteria bacterium]